MKKKTILILILWICISCTETFLGDEPADSAEAIFDQFWIHVDKTWPAFESKGVHWDSLYTVYRQQINSNTDNTTLTEILKDLLYHLKDQHTTIHPKGLPIIQYISSNAENFYGINWIRRNYRSVNHSQQEITYGFVQPSIGYIYISRFDGAASHYLLIDQILEEMKDAKGIIIDVRNNPGGSSLNSEIIASRFTTEEKINAYAKFRVNKIKTAMSDFITETFSPDGPFTFQNNVAVLTNRNSYSATEDFVLMMKALPQVIHIGDTTGGGSETRPIYKELPAGWSCRVSTKLLCDLNKQPISDGIAPDIAVETKQAGLTDNKDSIIERAIFELLK